MKKLITAVLAFTFVFGSATSINAAVRANLNNPEQGINISEGDTFGHQPPVLFGRESGPDPVTTFCKTLKDKPCVEAKSLNLWSQLSPCSLGAVTNCIDSFYAEDETGKKIPGEFVRYANEDSKWSFDESPSNNFPKSKGMGGVWKIAGLAGATTDLYYVSTYVNMFAEKTVGTEITSEQFDVGQFESGISPIKELAGQYSASVALDSSTKSSDGSKSGGVGASYDLNSSERDNCVMLEMGKCLQRQDFPSGYRFGMTIKVGKKLSGWFHGRIYRPELSITSSSNGQLIEIDALPVLVPSLLKKIPTTKISQELRTYLSQDRQYSEGSGYLMPGSSGKDAIDQAALWLPLIKDTATKSLQYWSFRMLNTWGESQDVQRCSNSSTDISGIVTTNALAYSAGPPTYNKSEGSLDYKVLAPHYTAKGDLAIGTYDLLLKSDVARCIYGFSKAPISGSISIVSESGQNNVATTVINEKNGWLYMSANGFSYSSPTVKVKLSQEAEVVVIPTPIPTPTPTPSASAKPVIKAVTITCIKGKTSKKVTAAVPKCPAGYNKK
ncbi:hypothetical protein MCEGKSH29_01187 [Candidatus Nanopelagicaceae bacterium]